MEQVILLNRSENLPLVEEEERFKWIRSILEVIGLNLDFWEDIVPDTDCLIKIMELIKQYNIIILNDHDGGVEMYVDDEKVAEWFKPRYVLRKDHSAIDPNKRLYIEMHTKSFSIFDS